ncbi:MAG: FadR family transcriptional regulator [Alphaproteobacteria bacterium]|nr:FadR family transcriptional regulator [Alphaproteobacteria bacterium]
MEAIISSRVMRNSHAYVVHEIGLSIIKGEFPLESILPGHLDLMEKYGVSRTVIREAMKTLSAKGLILPRSKVGTRVQNKSNWNLLDYDVIAWHFESGVDTEFLQHLSEIRLSFEPFAAELAAKNANEQDIAELFDLAEAMGVATDSRAKRAEVDVKFHLALITASKNPIMHSVGSMIEAALAGIFAISSPRDDTKKVDANASAHRAIVLAIADRDGQRARAAMENVIRIGLKRVLEHK